MRLFHSFYRLLVSLFRSFYRLLVSLFRSFYRLLVRLFHSFYRLLVNLFRSFYRLLVSLFHSFYPLRELFQLVTMPLLELNNFALKLFCALVGLLELMRAQINHRRKIAARPFVAASSGTFDLVDAMWLHILCCLTARY